jgi:hypothetical protein
LQSKRYCRFIKHMLFSNNGWITIIYRYKDIKTGLENMN